MHVVILGPDDFGNGVARVLGSWVAMLHGAGHKVTLVAMPPADPDRAQGLPEGVARIGTPLFEELSGLKRLNALGTAGAEIVAGLTDVDLVITHFQYQALAVRARLPKVRILATWHSPLVEEDYLNSWKYGRTMRRATYPLRRFALGRMERQALAAVDHVHTLSDFTWSRLNRHYPSVCAGKPWTRVPGCFDPRFRPPMDRAGLRKQLGLPKETPVLLSIRRLVPRNAPERILAAAKAARDAGVDALFLIGGAGELGDRMKDEIRAEGLQDSVRMLGFLAEEDLPRWYQAADATLMPTRDLECFGLPVVESLACGVPCLATPCGSPSEILAPFAGMLADANTAGAFTDRVLGFLRGEIEFESAELARHARATYSEEAVQEAAHRLIVSIVASAAA